MAIENAETSGAYVRSLGGLTFTVTISEAEKETARLTDYPVEDGATLSDHVILAPKEVTVKIGQGVDEAETDPRDKLEELRELMEKREPMELYTGKSYYPSMIITAINTATDSKSETVLLTTVTLREVRIAETKSAAVPVIRQKQPKKTAQSVKRGQQQLQESSTPENPNPKDGSVILNVVDPTGKGVRYDENGNIIN